jgi:hypothetical protein
MIVSVRQGKEIVVRVINEIGVLADVSSAVSDRGINIEAVNGYAVDNVGTIRLLVADPRAAIEVLKKAGYSDSKEKDALILETDNAVGALKAITSRLAGQRIDVKHIYGSICAKSCPAKLVLSTSDDAQALHVLNPSP